MNEKTDQTLCDSDEEICLACHKLLCKCDPKLKELLNYINTWADENERSFKTQDEKNGYVYAIMDVWEKVDKLYGE